MGIGGISSTMEALVKMEIVDETNKRLEEPNEKKNHPFSMFGSASLSSESILKHIIEEFLNMHFVSINPSFKNLSLLSCIPFCSGKF